MADRNETASNTPIDGRLAAIEQRQERLLADLDALDDRIEAALKDFGGSRKLEKH